MKPVPYLIRRHALTLCAALGAFTLFSGCHEEYDDHRVHHDYDRRHDRHERYDHNDRDNDRDYRRADYRTNERVEVSSTRRREAVVAAPGVTVRRERTYTTY